MKRIIPNFETRPELKEKLHLGLNLFI